MVGYCIPTESKLNHRMQLSRLGEGKLKIGISAPISTRELQDYLHGDVKMLPKGLGGTAVNLLVRSLLEQGHELVVYTLSPDVADKIKVRGDKLTICYGKYRTKGRFIDFFRKESEAIREMIASEPADIIHAHWTYEFAIGAIKSRLPHVVTVRDWAPLVLKSVPPIHYRFIRLLMNNWVFRNSRNFISNSYYISELVRKKYGYDTEVIPNPMNENLFLLTQKISKDKKVKIIAINNGFNNLKNVTKLIKAFSIINERYPGSELLLLGREYEKGGLAESWSVKEVGENRNIRFLGQQDYQYAMKLLREATLMIHPSLGESFGNVLVEAMILKVPVIAGERSGAVPWVLGFGDAGILVDVSDESKIADAAINILLDKEMYAHLQNSAFIHAHNNFHPDRIASKHIDVYKLVLEGQYPRT